MDRTPDPSAALEGLRKIEQAASKGPWRAVIAPNGTSVVETTWHVPAGYVGAGKTMHVARFSCTAGTAEQEEANAEFTATARTAMPRLAAALEAVLKAHRPSTSDGRCCWCREADGRRSAWPCGEYLTITRELSGEGGSDA
jgi:hypothetical protein